MIFKEFEQNTAYLRELVTQLIGYFSIPEIITLVPRFDFFTPKNLI